MSLGPVEILFAILGISILVIVHESGHYFAARAFGMRVTRYSIGFGPTLFKYQPKGSPTTFQVAAIPFLAYVQIAGMNPHEENDPDDPELFNNKSAFARIVTIAAGPIANYLTASLLVFFISLAGWPAPWLSNVFMPDDERYQVQPHEPMEVESVSEDSAAAEAGVEAGDIFLEANGVSVANVTELAEQTKDRGGLATEYLIERGGERLTISMTPREANGRALIGVVAVQGEMPPEHVAFDAGQAAWAALVFPWRLTEMQLTSIAGMIRERHTDNIGGPVAMTRMVGQAVQSGPTHVFAMLVLLSVALGMFNLLPLPALDGGRLTFLAYEVITRRRPNEKVEAMVHFIGILLLLGVLVLVTIRDIGNWS
ncbi:MAG: membrane-associated zinc metalloprotease [Sandaracinus sp.]|nr:membrane-associated zinc metalloprotease [Sandaracinus sp.]